MTLARSYRRTLAVCVVLVASLFGGAGSALLGLCGPFTDVTDPTFCPFVLEIFTLGITTGTGPTTYDPTGTVSRLQMAAFLARTVDGVLKRGSRRAALDQTWIPQAAISLGLTTVGSGPQLLKADGADVWVANFSANTVSRVRASDGKQLETWTGATEAFGVLAATGRIFVTAPLGPGLLYRIDPTQAAGVVTTVSTNLGFGPRGIAFDGTQIWTANSGGSISIVTPGATIPWTVTTVGTGFNSPKGALFDGANIWVTDTFANTLLKLSAAGVILQTVTLGAGTGPLFPAFDGSNIWVPNNGAASVSVVRASTGAVLTTLTGNGLASPNAAAFDGQRVLVTNFNSGSSVSLFKSADLTPLGSFPTGSSTFPTGVCSDGVNFWITLNSGFLARF